MRVSKVWMNKEDITAIQQILEQFPKVERFQIKEHSQSGIGSCIDMVFDTEVNQTKCKITVPIADETKW